MAGRFLLILPALVAFLVGAVPALAWTWPVDGPVLQPFGVMENPYAAGQHRGVDIGGTAGEPVVAPASGEVAFAGHVPGAGRTVTIRTGDGYSVTLLHLGAVSVARGGVVGEGDVVGAVGPSGESEHAEPYVHLGVRIASDPQGYVDPLAFLPARTGASAAKPVDGTEPPPVEEARGETAASGSAPESTQPNGAVAQSPVAAATGESRGAVPPPPPAEASGSGELAATPAIPVQDPGPPAPSAEAGLSEQATAAEPSVQAIGDADGAEVGATSKARGEDRPDSKPSSTAASTSGSPELSARARAAKAPRPGKRERSARAGRHEGQAAAAFPLGLAAASGRSAARRSTSDPLAPSTAEAPGAARPAADRSGLLTDPTTLALLAGLGVALLVLRRPAGGGAQTAAADPLPGPVPAAEVGPPEAPSAIALSPCPLTTRRRTRIRRRELPNPRRIIASDDLLRHDADLLRQLDAAHRPRVLDDRRGHRRAPPSAAR
jgi:hypothetical protein